MKISLYFCLVSLWLLVSAGGINGRELKRSKRDWKFPTFYVPETKSGYTFRPGWSRDIKSNNAGVAYYTLSGKEVDDGIFSIKLAADGKNGIITQEKGLDREKSDQFELLLSAYDSNGNSVEKDDTLKFIVTDKNDNSPIFNEATLYQKVQEDVTKNTNVFGISATDLDSDDDDNNKVKYFKVPNSEKPTGNRFKVNTLGQVQVIGDLDAELVPKVTFEVYAKDNDGRDGGLQSPNQVVTVEILDANDHAPVFLNIPYKLLNLSELASVGEKVFEFEATDADKGLNSMVTFKIKSGNDKGFFTIKSSSTGSGKSYGQVYLNNALDFESYQRSFHLTIVGYNANATNADVIDFQSETDLRIEVKDENEPPVFINGPYKSQIEENDLNKDLVPKIEVKDEDFGGQKVTLTLGNNDEGWFKINSDTGIVSTLKPLDREHKSVDSETSIYILQVIATDPMGLQSHLDYAVEILDVNDNAPMPFGNGWTATVCSAYPDEMTEVNVTRLTAQDFDSKTNGPPFKFSFPPNSIFDLETRDGVSVQVITTPTKLRRSGKNLYEEEITIIDATAPRLTGSGTLTVNVCRQVQQTFCSLHAFAHCLLLQEIWFYEAPVSSDPLRLRFAPHKSTKLTCLCV